LANVRATSRPRRPSRAADILESTPFELWDGTNSFGDEFQLLYLRAPSKTYLKFEAEVDNKQLFVYSIIARTFEKLNVLIRFIAVDVDLTDDNEINPVTSPNLKITSAVVDRALTDAQLLITSSGAVGGRDRVHTAFHGCLGAVCQDAGIAFGGVPSITELYKLLKRNHPALQGSLPRVQDTDRILGMMSGIIDALNPLRNRASVAHPNDELLEEPEAELVINAVRTLLHYFNKRLR
jgi:hypothetical protein